MPALSKRSRDNRDQCHPALRLVIDEAAKSFDFTVICGVRDKANQETAYRDKKSKARFGQSPHNFEPALAFDAVPYPIDWNDTKRFKAMAEVMKAAAVKVGVKITWGGDFKSFTDMPHFELTGWQSMPKTLAK